MFHNFFLLYICLNEKVTFCNFFVYICIHFCPKKVCISNWFAQKVHNDSHLIGRKSFYLFWTKKQLTTCVQKII